MSKKSNPLRRRKNISRGRVKPVAVVMGSQSDFPHLKEAIQLLRKFKVPVYVEVVSAHRTPAKLTEFAQSAAEKFSVIIAGAGGSAHLPGMIAAFSIAPVIGVPVPTRNLKGLDSLLSIVQMPPGVPVATVAMGGAHNAGLLAIQMLALNDPRLASILRADKAKQRDKVKTMNKKIRGFYRAR